MPHFIVHLSHTGCYKRVLCILGAASRVLSDQHCSLTSVDTTDAAPRLPASHRVSFNRGSTSDRMDAMTGRSANGSAAEGDGEVVDSSEATEGSKKEVEEKKREAPTVLLWLLFLLAQVGGGGWVQFC